MVRFSVHLRGSTLMILVRTVAVLAVWAVFAGFAHAADPAQADCLSADPDRSIAGCTAVLTHGDEAVQDRAVAFYNRGNAYRYRGDTERAIADYSEAIRLKPDYALAYYNRGDAYAGKSKYDGACRKVCERGEKRADWLGLRAGLPSYGRCEMRPRPAHPTAIFKLCDRPFSTAYAVACGSAASGTETSAPQVCLRPSGGAVMAGGCQAPG